LNEAIDYNRATLLVNYYHISDRCRAKTVLTGSRGRMTATPRGEFNEEGSDAPLKLTCQRCRMECQARAALSGVSQFSRLGLSPVTNAITL
jgi:hypothetical protein